MSSARVSRGAADPAPPRSLPTGLAAISGLRAGLLNMALGAIAALGQAPLHLWPFTALALTAFVWQLDGATMTKRPRWAGFWRGWSLGFGYFVAGLWWVSSALLVEPDRYAMLIPLAVGVLPAGLALFWGAIGAVAISFWRRDWRRIIVLATVFFIFEYLRGHVLTGFPWSLAGYVWPAGGAVSQSAAFIGAYGLTALTLLAFMSPAALAAPLRRGVSSITPPIAAAALFALLFGAGEYRLATAETAVEPNVRLRIVQAGIDQREKFPSNRANLRRRYLELTAREGLESRTHVIWGEAALPYRLYNRNDDMSRDTETLEAIARTLGDGRILLTGYARIEVPVRLGQDTGLLKADDEGLERRQYFNSFGVFPVEAGSALVSSYYDKVKLVPFGEFFPFVGLAKKLAPRALVDFADGYSSGGAPVAMAVPGAPPVAPQICYEVVFSGFTPRGVERPGWIINAANDSWYRGTPGPVQLYNQARYRAIEEGLPLARSASGGYSALVDPYGRPVADLPDGSDGVIDADLPAALKPPLYALVGDAPGFLMFFAGLFFGLTRRRERL